MRRVNRLSINGSKQVLDRKFIYGCRKNKFRKRLSFHKTTELTFSIKTSKQTSSMTLHIKLFILFNKLNFSVSDALTQYDFSIYQRQKARNGRNLS